MTPITLSIAMRLINLGRAMWPTILGQAMICRANLAKRSLKRTAITFRDNALMKTRPSTLQLRKST